MVGPRGIDFLLALACGVVMIGAAHLLLMERAEWFAFDRLSQWTVKARPLNSSLAMVVVDSKSIEELGQANNWPWPWPRSAYADIIAFLRASGAREIWIDLTSRRPMPKAFRDDELRAVAAAAAMCVSENSKTERRFFSRPSTSRCRRPRCARRSSTRTSRGKHLLGWPPTFNTLIRGRTARSRPPRRSCRGRENAQGAAGR